MKLKPMAMLISSLLLAGCAGYIDENPVTSHREISNNTSRPTTSKPTGGNTGDTGDTPVNPDNPVTPDEPIEEDPTYTVCLKLNGKLYNEDDLEDCRAVFYDLNNKTEFPVEFNEEGYAITDQLDGDYAIHLQNCPEDYTYDPNIYFTDYVNKYTEINLIPLTPLLGTGKTPYDDIYKMSKVGTYRYTIKNKRTELLYAQFEPKKAGVYTIETLCDIYEDNIDPTVELYSGTAVWKNLDNPTVLNDGGTYRKGGYTKNIKYTVKIADQFIGNVFAYGLRATVKDGVYPINIDFRISYLEDYYWEDIKAETMESTVPDFKTPDLTGAYTFANLGGLVFDGKNYVFNQTDGFFHYKTVDGPIVCADIDTPSQFLDVSLTHVQDSGNKNLTVSDGTENYTDFICNVYQRRCNSAGRCYVTMELKEFLQKYSNSQLLFQDGNGYIEYESHHYAAEPDQWLWACGFYGQP